MKKSFPFIVLASVLLMILFPLVRPVYAIVITSSFDSSDDGWIGIPGEGAVSFVSSGGNPGGHIRVTDIGTGGPLGSGAIAPSNFLGNLSAFNGGTLSINLATFAGGGPTFAVFGTVRISGAGDFALFDLASVAPPFGAWQSYSAPLTASAWGKTPLEWSAILGNVTEIAISTDAFDGADTIGIDNFTLSSPPTSPTLRIGGFDISRSNFYSFPSGAFFDEARASLAANFPGTSLTEFSTLTTGTVNGIDILIISSTTSNTSHFTPLTTSEQNVLFDFAQGGGCAILLPDNSTFGGAGTPAANESLIDPFGLDIGGTLPGKVLATVPNPSVSTITNGPFGVVSSFSQNVPGGLTNLGSFASSLAVNPLGDALAVIEAGVLGPRSGRVVIYSDVNMFGDSDAAGFFSENQALFLNTIQFCGVRIATAVTIDIKPGSFPNSINLGSQGTIPVAIFSSPSFDATIIDPLTVTLANASVRLKGNGNPMASFEDVDGDGLLDVIVHIDTSTLMLTEADTEAVLEAQTVGGQRIVGRDSVRIVP